MSTRNKLRRIIKLGWRIDINIFFDNDAVKFYSWKATSISNGTKESTEHFCNIKDTVANLYSKIMEIPVKDII